ncbi:MAG: DUF1552 domain-containing protein [Verrucomicrobiales bacterium]|nr:DUF1552 domain-containing protein [Verrucomicrobiales bacterium]
MNILNHQPLDRRTALRGMGATMALPFLESMLPKSALASTEAATSAIPRRGAWFYFGTGMNMRQFEPQDEGKDFTFPRILKPLEKFRGDLTVFSGTYLEHGGGHHGDYTFLTGVEAKKGGAIKNAVSCDQVAAEAIGRDTRFPSLQLCIQRGTGFGANLRTLSWNRNGVPLASENDPHVVFNRLFKVDGPEEREAREKGFRRRGSILDVVLEDAHRLEKKVGSQDKEKLDEYFNSIREVEKQLERNVDWSVKPKPEIDPETANRYGEPYSINMPAGQFAYEKYARLMYDLITLAFQTDSTRVITYVVRQESSGGVFPEFGVSKGYHELSHHGNDPKNLDELAAVDAIYQEHWAYFLGKMKSVKEADGRSLLDHCALGYSSGMGIGHSKTRLPTAMFGGNALGIEHQGHLKLPDETPLSSVWHTMLDRLEVPVGESFQDSPGVIQSLIS